MIRRLLALIFGGHDKVVEEQNRGKEINADSGRLREEARQVMTDYTVRKERLRVEAKSVAKHR